VEDRSDDLFPGLEDVGSAPRAGEGSGNELGTHCADYVLHYVDGGEEVFPIRRRFAIQQRHISWGASPFAAVPMLPDEVFHLATEDHLLGQVAPVSAGAGGTRQEIGRASPAGLL